MRGKSGLETPINTGLQRSGVEMRSRPLRALTHLPAFRLLSRDRNRYESCPPTEYQLLCILNLMIKKGCLTARQLFIFVIFMQGKYFCLRTNCFQDQPVVNELLHYMDGKLQKRNNCNFFSSEFLFHLNGGKNCRYITGNGN